MRLLCLVAIAALAVAACGQEPRVEVRAAPTASASATLVPVVAKLPIAERLYQDGIRVAPDGRYVLVIQHTTREHIVYDLSGHIVARASITTPPDQMWESWWLPDTTGVVMAREVRSTSPGTRTLELSILELDGREHALATGVSLDGSFASERGALSSADGAWLAVNGDTSTSIDVISRSGTRRPVRLVSGTRNLTVLGWDADRHVIYWDGELVRGLRTDGDAYAVPLDIPAGVKVLQLWSGGATPDYRVLQLVLQADRWFPGAGETSFIALRALIDRRISTPASWDLRPMSGGWVGGHELIRRAGTNDVVRFDAVSGASAILLKNDAEHWPTAISDGIVVSVAGRSHVGLVDLTVGTWHEVDLGFVTDTFDATALTGGRFLIFDEDGAMHVLDGRAALAAPARVSPAPITATNERVGTIRRVSPRNSETERPSLVWRYPDGTPESMDEFRGSNVIVFWNGSCAACLEQIARAERVASANIRIKLAVFAIGIGETEQSAITTMGPFSHVRPLVVATDRAAPLGLRSLPAVWITGTDGQTTTTYGTLTEDDLRRAIGDAK